MNIVYEAIMCNFLREFTPCATATHVCFWVDDEDNFSTISGFHGNTAELEKAFAEMDWEALRMQTEDPGRYRLTYCVLKPDGKLQLLYSLMVQHYLQKSDTKPFF